MSQAAILGQVMLGLAQAESRFIEVAKLVPALHTSSLRLRRRLCTQGQLLLNNQVVKPTTKVRAGQVITLLAAQTNWPEPFDFSQDKTILSKLAALKPNLIAPDLQPDFFLTALQAWHQLEPKLIKAQNGLAAIFKPSGLHTVSLAGGQGTSLESFLPALLNSLSANYTILNRLDYYTCGLVMVAYTGAGQQLWYTTQQQGLIHKQYLAVVENTFANFEPLTIKTQLDTHKRKQTRLKSNSDPDPKRWTKIYPLMSWSDATLNIPLSLVQCEIYQGARHQIRAHLSSLDHPLSGDSLYGSGQAYPFFLQHFSLIMPNLTFSLN